MTFSFLPGNAGDAELGVRLTVAADPVPTLFLRAEVPELAVLAVGDHLGLHAGARHGGRAELHLRPFADQEDFQVQLRPDVLRQLFYLEEVAFLDAVLLAARPDHCVHRRISRLSGLGPAWLAGKSRRRARKGTGDLAGPVGRVKQTSRSPGERLVGLRAPAARAASDRMGRA